MHPITIIGERERANLVVQLARFFYIVYIQKRQQKDKKTTQKKQQNKTISGVDVCRLYPALMYAVMFYDFSIVYPALMYAVMFYVTLNKRKRLGDCVTFSYLHRARCNVSKYALHACHASRGEMSRSG